MNDAIGLVMIFVLLTVFVGFANLAIGRKRGDAQIIDDLLKTRDEAYSKIRELQNELEKSKKLGPKRKS